MNHRQHLETFVREVNIDLETYFRNSAVNSTTYMRLSVQGSKTCYFCNNYSFFPPFVHCEYRGLSAFILLRLLI
jgi:hypothetical protein